MLYRFVRFYFHIPIFLRLLLTVLSIMLLFGTIMYWAEPDEFTTWFDGVWFAFITGATVGYGDFVPETVLGQLLTILLILAGGGLLTFYMVTLSSGAIKREDDYKKGEVAFHGEDHMIIVGWNERTRRLIELIETQYGKQTDLVLIDETLEEDPVNHTNVHFIHSDPTIDDTWEKANLPKADKVIVTADQTKIEKEADVHTILVILTVRGLQHDIPILGEILTEKQKRNAERAGATEVICSNETTSTLFYHELTGNEYVKAFDYVMALLSQQQFIIDSVYDEWIDQSILELSEITKQEGQLLLGFIRDNEIKINPDPNERLQEDDQVIMTKTLLE
ncbi:potassium channel family protein [Alkalibacillus almallahensis]|uniref:potassium channel family protein n=1 Tax=Alkalibacillus almallahensis TaxID=1379154 RepID=UPI00142012EF|nr:potassium channel family protein [Alkalibacillus almallahensis]NIK12146.1 voltage-gated potassium channel [Alkalibacillus almallahensis]